MSSPCNNLDELKAFHDIDRRIYARLVIDLRLEPNQSKKVVAFWIRLEIRGVEDFVFMILPLPDQKLHALAHEAMTFLHYLSQAPAYDVDKDLPLMLSLVEPRFSFWDFYPEREKLISEIEEIKTYLCDFAFSDIVPTMVQSSRPQSGFMQPQFSNRREGFPSYQVLEAPAVSVAPNFSNSVQVQPSVPQAATSSTSLSPLVPSFHTTGRFLLMNFSKGHYVTREELQEYITRRFGNCIESILMKPQPNMAPPLYANVVVRSSSDIQRILGGKETAIFKVNGKQVWARRLD
nr:hypothetical protein CFP56_47296 [Quercus suber]